MSLISAVEKRLKLLYHRDVATRYVMTKSNTTMLTIAPKFYQYNVEEWLHTLL